jgi:hypothetical protein
VQSMATDMEVAKAGELEPEKENRRARKPVSVSQALADRWLDLWGASERGEDIPEYDDGTPPGTDRPMDDPRSNVFKIAQASAAVRSFRKGLGGGLLMVEVALHVWRDKGPLKDFKSTHREVETVFQGFSMSQYQRVTFLSDKRRVIRDRLASMIMDTYHRLPKEDRTGVAEAALAPSDSAPLVEDGLLVKELRPYTVPTPNEKMLSTGISGISQVQNGESAGV